MKIVFGYSEITTQTPSRIKRLFGKSFATYGKVMRLLQKGDTVVTQHPQGFKSVGIDKDGREWVQRFFAHEY
jgi:hypothetical protein